MQVQSVTSMWMCATTKVCYYKISVLWDKNRWKILQQLLCIKFFGARSFHIHQATPTVLFFGTVRQGIFGREIVVTPPPFDDKFSGTRNFQKQKGPLANFSVPWDERLSTAFFWEPPLWLPEIFAPTFSCQLVTESDATKLASSAISPKFLLLWAFNHLCAYVSSLIQNKMLIFEKYFQNVPNVLSWEFVAIFLFFRLASRLFSNWYSRQRKKHIFAIFRGASILGISMPIIIFQWRFQMMIVFQW